MKRALPEQAEEAAEKYEEFHRYGPRKIGSFSPSFRIPQVVYKAGRAKWVTYRSGKVDPETLRKPSKPVSYIHEHDSGVVTYLTERGSGDRVDVPAKFRDVGALTRLGFCLGFCFEGPEGKVEAEGRAPLPDLYTTPDGKCLLVIQGRRNVLAMTWGGGLGVFARGIDG